MTRRSIAFAAVLLAALAALAWWAWPDRVADNGAAAGRPATAESVARGAYLVRVGNCTACHTERGGVPFAGGRPIETPFGTVYSTNLTPHPEAGLGAWSREDFWQALHDGRSRDGRLLTPAFPYPNYTVVARADADAMYDYLRSLPAAGEPNRPHRLRWPYRTQAALALWRALYFERAPRLEQAPAAGRERGAYLVQGLGHCSACHGPRNALGAGSNLMDLSGGLIPMQNWYAPSLTSPAEAGVANWPLAEIERLLATGVSASGTVLGPMAEVVLHSTQHLARSDLRAMAMFLQSLPQAAAPAVQPAVPTPREMAERGSKLYERHCAACHGARGEGVPGAYPALAGNRAVTLPVTANLVQVVLHGGFAPATAGNPRPFGMPPFATLLGDRDVAAVLTHVRTSWGNRAAPVAEVDVVRQRGTTY
ncbi:cytochrome c [Ramlibacter sp. RBP-2]|uniref:Cytochrome c n=1 Tax=Ramlibacter lithotrophicus TaxID=2606681 RepID=A0A7X6I7J7_9BURK|nr:cytochrome c [Ramlibacter lithotrophicus]NKE67371.1 cytochrome c [Ramlibacter lithotrophicus]